MIHFYVLVPCLLHVAMVTGQCPQDADIPRWSDAATWPGNVKPNPNDDVTISGDVKYDVAFQELGEITVLAGGSLVFDPALAIHLRTTKITVNGSLIIGSEECPYDGQLKITFIGMTNTTVGVANAKGIGANPGGKLEIHGEPKLSWTKITSTLVPLAQSGDLLFEHKTFDEFNPTIPVDQWEDRGFVNGMAAYTIRCDEGGNPIIKNFQEYSLVTEGSQLAARINDLLDGEVLMLASQKTIKLKSSRSQQEQVFDALETLLFGEVTGTSLLRAVSQTSTYALVYQKDGGDSHYIEVSGAKGEDSVARLISSKKDLVFEAFTLGAAKSSQQVDDFRILTYNGVFPLINTVDDVTSWSAGDRVVFASTDYDWEQAEERTVVECLDCDNNQFRIDLPVNFVHWGEFMHEAVDMRAEVGLITRNVVIEGEMEDYCPPSNGNCDKKEVRALDTFGGHIKVGLITRNVVIEGEMGDYCPSSNVNCDKKEIRALGTFDGHLKILGNGVEFHIEGALLFNLGQHHIIGQYPVHVHMARDSVTSPYVRDNTIYQSFAHCVVLHASNDVQVLNNFCYDHMGHGFLLEDGAEMNNTIEGNLALGTRKGTGDLEPSEQTNPSAFWISNPKNRVVNNVGAGGEGSGLWFIYPDLPLEPSTSLNTMDRFEARSTPIEEFYNNVGHSNSWVGVILGSRLDPLRRIIPQNTWQPRANPKDPSSTPLEFTLEKITGYKNRRNNVWIEAGMATVKKVSSSDSLNGITVTNDGLVDLFTGTLTDSVMVGDSSNIGVPTVIPERSIPLETRLTEPHSGLTLWKGSTRHKDLWFGGSYESDNYDIAGIAVKLEPHSGLTLWKGPTRHKDLWFGGSYESDNYDIAGIAMKRFSPYFFSVQTELKDLLFAFEDSKNGAARAISGLEGVDPGWKSRDGAFMAGFKLVTNETELNNVTYVTRPDHLSAAARTCRVRANWRLALCTTKYGNIKMSSTQPAVFVRDDLPSAQLEFDVSGNVGPQVVLDGSRMYTIHFPNKIPGKLSIKGEGMERGDVLIIGVCLPRDNSFLLKSNVPIKVKPTEFIAVDSLQELKRETADDGRKYFLNSTTGMFWFKFVDIRVNGPDAMHTCKDGLCPDIVLDKIKGSKTDADCRERHYGSDLTMPLPSQKKFDVALPANGPSSPPPGWGAGSTLPFENRSPVDGGYGDWSKWSACSKTCDDGITFRNRKCNSPLPRNGGQMCAGNSTEVMPCRVIYCPIKGDFTEWSVWSACAIRSADECQGRAVRTRTCTNPTPQYNGEDCEGAVEEIMPCNNCTST